MNDFFTQLPARMKQLEDIKAALERTLTQLRNLQEVVGKEIPVLETLSVPKDLMGWGETKQPISGHEQQVHAHAQG
jgi:hypothetical protein